MKGTKKHYFLDSLEDVYAFSRLTSLDDEYFDNDYILLRAFDRIHAKVIIT